MHPPDYIAGGEKSHQNFRRQQVAAELCPQKHLKFMNKMVARYIAMHGLFVDCQTLILLPE